MASSPERRQSIIDNHHDHCFNADILLKHISKSELCSIMDELVDDLRQENFLKYFTVSMSTGLEEMEMEYENAKDKHNQEPTGRVIKNRINSGRPLKTTAREPKGGSHGIQEDTC